jgi:hypothetical protein
MSRISFAFISLALILAASSAAAQPVGTFRWQLQPNCNIVTLSVTQQGEVYTLDGFDDQCGAATRASVVGTAFLNADGAVGIGLTTVLAPGGTPVHIDARIDLASLGGPWRDSAGNSGTFVLTPGAGTGGPLRPVTPNGVAPGSITAVQLAPGSVSGATVLDGSITSADLLDGPRAAFASGSQSLALTPTPKVVRTVTITPPAAGRVIVNAGGYFELPFPNPIDFAFAACSITTGTSYDATHETGAEAIDAAGALSVPFAAARGFSVGAGGITFYLLCRGAALNGLNVRNTSLTAIFVAGS